MVIGDIPKEADEVRYPTNDEDEEIQRNSQSQFAPCLSTHHPIVSNDETIENTIPKEHNEEGAIEEDPMACLAIGTP